MASLSLCLIVRDESEVLDRCLQSVEGVADELIVVDTGSVDDTVAIAQRHGARIGHFAWCDDFAAARNHSFSLATKDYILWLDADDVLLPRDREGLLLLKSQLLHDVYYLRYDYAQDEYGHSLCMLYRERIVRNCPEIRWRHPVHEYLTVHGRASQMVDVTITHRRTAKGYENDVGRNLAILKRAIANAEYANDARVQFYLAREYQDAGDLENAIVWFTRAIEGSPASEDRALALHRLALCHYALALKEPGAAAQHRERARAAARNSVRIEPARSEGTFLLGLMAAEDGLLEEAVFWHSRALREPPSTIAQVDAINYGVGPATQLCIAWDRLGDYRRSHYFNELALTMRPNDEGLLYNRAYLRGRLNATNPRLAFGAPVEGYLRCGERPDPEADDIFPLHAIPRAESTVTAIACSRVPSRAEASAVYAEWLRVLQPGGVITMTTGARGDATNAGTAIELMNAGFVIHYAWQGGERLEIRALKPRRTERIAFVGEAYSLDIPQYRIRIYHVTEWLRSQGYRVEVARTAGYGCDIAVFYGRCNEAALRSMERARQSGKRVLLDVCEDLLDIEVPCYSAMIAAADVVVACSHALAARLRAVNPNVIVIEDAVESDGSRSCTYDERRRLTFAWIGMDGNQHHAERLRPLLHAAGHQLLAIHSGADADVPWRLDTWQAALARCDAAIVPLAVSRQPSKSNNKITTCMALGLPVVASPLDAYLRILQHGENGLIAVNDADWSAAFERLKDPYERARLGRAGRESASAFSIAAIGAKWIALLFEYPVVDIVIPTCGADAHLKVCLASIAAVTDVPHRVIVVDAAARENPPDPGRRATLIRSERRLHFAEAINGGIEAGTAPYVCILNDDTIVTRHWLQPLLEQVQARPGLCNPLSNNDFGTAHDHVLSVGGVPLLPGMNVLEDGRIKLRGSRDRGVPVEALYDYNPGHSRLLERPWLVGFCTLFPRFVFERVGRFDEDFINGVEDIDYGRRAARLGYPSVIDERSFVFHFGSTTRGVNHAQTDERNLARLEIKHGSPLVVLHTGGAFESWNAVNVEDGGIGGSETAAARIAAELARRDHRVVVFGECEGKEGVVDGVEYLHYERLVSFASTNHADVYVASRNAVLLDAPLRTGRRYLWVHDVMVMEPPGSEWLRRRYDTLDAIFCLSPWHRDVVSAHHGIGTEKIIVSRNGIDPERFRMKKRRKRNRFIYSSSPDRGLDTLLEIFPRIRAEVPDAELHVFYGFDNWEKMLAMKPDPHGQAWMESIRAALQQPGVHYHGRVGQRRLAEELVKSDVWLYPTRFTETYCITALEAQMAGVACICSDLAGLRYTVGSRGVLLTGDAYSEDYRQRAVEETIALLHDRKRRNAMAAAARAWASQQSWSALAEEWMSIFASSGH